MYPVGWEFRGDENPIRTLGDYSKPSHERYRNAIKLPVRNNVVPHRSDTIRIAWKTLNKPLLTMHDEAGGQEEKGNLGNINSNPHSQPDLLASITTIQVRKLNSMLESLGLVPQSSNTKFVCSKENDREVMFIEIIRDDDEPLNKSLNEDDEATTKGPAIEYLGTFPTIDELTYHNGGGGGRSVNVVLVVAVKLEGTSANAVRALKKFVGREHSH
nr:hypothetical protein [Tanacetum cinerariifolium]